VTGSWQARAACARLVATGQASPADWDGDGDGDAARAITVCDSCPVRVACLTDALATERGLGPTSRHGVRASLTPPQRARLDATPKRRGRPPSAAPCGTEAAARAHHRRGEPACKRCLAAAKDARADRLATRAA
jgi:hypothetical protein